MRGLACIIILLLCGSCATLTLKRNYPLKVFSNSLNSGIEVNQKGYTLPAIVPVTRSKENLVLTFYADSLEKQYVVRTFTNNRFRGGNIFWFPFSYLIDLTNPRRFTYGPALFLDVNDTATLILSKEPSREKKLNAILHPTNKGRVNVNFSLPWINNFNIKPEGVPRKTTTGFVGLSAGIDYYYKEKKFLNGTAGGVLDFPYPFPVPIDYYGGTQESTASAYLTLTDNWVLKRFTLGYGIQYSFRQWQRVTYDSLGINVPATTITSKIGGFGPVVNTYYHVKRNFYIGVIYRPTIWMIRPKSELGYEHGISIDFLWRWNARE